MRTPTAHRPARLAARSRSLSGSPPPFEARIEQTSIASIRGYANNARTHSDKQIAKLEASIRRFGFTNPVLIGDNGEIVAGHGRLEAAKRLGLMSVPTIRLAHLNEKERQAYRLADNRLAELAGWDDDLLRLELGALIDFGFEIELTGFDTAEIDVLLEPAADIAACDPDDAIDRVDPDATAVSRPGDLWDLGRHRIICGDALDAATFDCLLGVERADCVFTDPPYNVKIAGHVSGLGKRRHREFAMASGEMSKDHFRRFLDQTVARAAAGARAGAVLFTCMDWRSVEPLLASVASAELDLLNLCVWNKTNAGMGSLYRSKHEFVVVARKGGAPHINNVELGRHGRYRTNVWDYAGANAFHGKRDEELALHPTVKPVALVADAIRDVTNHGDIILDLFGGSGTTLIAAERTGRRGRLIELDPLYVDATVRRFEKATGETARCAATGASFADIARARATQREEPAAEENAPDRRPPTGGLPKSVFRIRTRRPLEPHPSIDSGAQHRPDDVRAN